MRATLTIAHLTWLEARRRRIVLVAVLGGLLFLLIYAVAVLSIHGHMNGSGSPDLVQRRAQLQLLLHAGLYVVNLLVIAIAILLPVDTLAGEIGSGVMQTLVSKPIRRSEIVLGKWLTYWLMTAGYLVLMAGGVAAVVTLFTGYVPPNLERGLPLMLLGGTVMMTVSLAGGVRLTTISNGMMAFALYGIAFVGGWIEQIGALVRNDAARQIGTAISLLSPADAMWRRAAYELQPPLLRAAQSFGPFVPASVPSTAMILWAVAFVAIVLAGSLYLFGKRPL